MSTNAQSSQTDAQAYYNFLRDTTDLARTLVEQTATLDEPAIAANALIIYQQLAGLVSDELQGLVGSIQGNG